MPVIGLPSGTQLKDARQRFYNDAQSMLIEGYTKVDILDSILQKNMLMSSKVQRIAFLCAYAAWGAAHDPAQVCGRAQRCTDGGC